jgi:ABC-type amino acid transport substrate-binding protein
MALPYEVKIPRTKSENKDMPDYFQEQALRLALAKTSDTDGEAAISYLRGEYTPQRLRSFLINTDQLDVMWSTSTTERESKMRPVKFNLLKGINEYRRLLIHKDQHSRFYNIASRHDLQKLTAGVSLYWSDADVLEENNIKYILAPNYESTIKMLSAKRFDFVMRGAQEINEEIEKYKNLNLDAVDDLYIHYCLPVYFFVKKENIRLADRLLKGLQLSAADGSLDELFFSVPVFSKAFQDIKHFPSYTKVIEFSNRNCD